MDLPIEEGRRRYGDITRWTQSSIWAFRASSKCMKQFFPSLLETHMGARYRELELVPLADLANFY